MDISGTSGTSGATNVVGANFLAGNAVHLNHVGGIGAIDLLRVGGGWIVRG